MLAVAVRQLHQRYIQINIFNLFSETYCKNKLHYTQNKPELDRCNGSGDLVGARAGFGGGARLSEASEASSSGVGLCGSCGDATDRGDNCDFD